MRANEERERERTERGLKEEGRLKGLPSSISSHVTLLCCHGTPVAVEQSGKAQWYPAGFNVFLVFFYHHHCHGFMPMDEGQGRARVKGQGQAQQPSLDDKLIVLNLGNTRFLTSVVRQLRNSCI